MTKEQIIKQAKKDGFGGLARIKIQSYLSSLQESTESRVREEFRAAVEELKESTSHDDDPVAEKAKNKDCACYLEALDNFQSLLQDPKKQ